MRKKIGLILASTATLWIQACGGVGSDNEKSAPPPQQPGNSETLFSLQNGPYYVANIRDLQDGCGMKPLEGSHPLTQERFNLVNDGNGRITMDFCTYAGTSLSGYVAGNSGTLAVIHNNVARGVGRFDRECRMDVTVLGDNKFQGHFLQAQRNRNAALREASGINQSECQTSFNFIMERRD